MVRPPLVIVGAGGHGREVLDIVEALGRCGDGWDFRGFLDDGPTDGDRLARRGAEVLGSVDWLAEHPEVHYALGIGDSGARRTLDHKLGRWGCTAATLVHPRATVASDNRLAPGVVVAAGAHVTTNVSLGRHTHLNVGAVVQHDTVVGDFVTCSPGAFVNGDVVLHDDVFLGTGAIVTRGCTVGARARVGAGAVVLSDVAPDTTVVGVPARPRP